ncbi:MAG: M16 family metallopeptidase [Kofleriaceae bacterium]
MKARRWLSVLLVFLVACGGAKPGPATPGSNEQATANGSAQPATSNDAVLPLWPEVKKGKLANGLTYYILKHGKPEKRALLWLAVNAGSNLEADDQRGLAHFTEHMAFNGTKRFPEAAIIEYLQKIGMRFGADLNAYTNFDETVYQLEVPTDDKTYVAKGLDILRDWAGNVTFAPAEVEKERGVVLEEWRLGRGAGQRIFDKQAKVLFKGSRYADRLPIGDPEVIKKAPRDAMVRFYKDWYRPDLMAVIAVGDIDPATIEAEIQSKFADLTGPANPRPRVRAEVPKPNGTRITIDTDRELPGVRISVYNLVPHRSEATANDYRRLIVELLYGQIVNERLTTIGRRADAPFTIAGVGAQGVTREIDAFTRFAQVKDGKVEDAVRALFTEVIRVERHGFTQSELDRARANLARFYEQIDAEAMTSDSSEYSAEITRNFFEGELMIGRKAEKEHTLKILPTITVPELEALANSYGGAENRVIMIAGPEGEKAIALPTRDRVLALISEVEKAKVDAWEDKAVATTLLATPPAPGKIVKESKVDAVGVTEWRLSNGVRVVVKPSDFEADDVSVSGDSPGGLAMASNKEFLNARFADDIAGFGGVGELDGETLRKALTGKHVAVAASIGETTESIDASGSARDLETMFQLIYLKMTAPRKDAQIFEVWKANTVQQLTEQLRSPEFQFALESQAVLYKGNVRMTLPAPGDFAKIDQDKAIAFYRDRFGDASDFTFVIVGQVDLAKLKPLVEQYLASLPAKGRKEKERDAGVRRVKGVVKKQWSLGQEKASVALTFHGDDKWTRDKERDMMILGQVFGMKLRETLREDMGGVYGVQAGGQLERTGHQERAFTIQFGCAPDAADKLIKATLDEASAVAKNGADAEQLEKIKAQLLRQRETLMRTNDFWLAWLSSAYRYGDDPTLILDPSKIIARITSDNIKASAKRFLDPKQYYQAVMMPPGAATGAFRAPRAVRPMLPRHVEEPRSSVRFGRASRFASNRLASHPGAVDGLRL